GWIAAAGSSESMRDSDLRSKPIGQRRGETRPGKSSAAKLSEKLAIFLAPDRRRHCIGTWHCMVGWVFDDDEGGGPVSELIQRCRFAPLGHRSLSWRRGDCCGAAGPGERRRNFWFVETNGSD